LVEVYILYPTCWGGHNTSAFQKAGLFHRPRLFTSNPQNFDMTLRQFLWDNFGFDIYEWDEGDIRF
jgi:hypothetical protein